MADDEPHKLARNYGNHVGIAPYMGAADAEELLWLAEYLARVADCPNPRALEKLCCRDKAARLGKRINEE
jgi:hypothetical protein